MAKNDIFVPCGDNCQLAGKVHAGVALAWAQSKPLPESEADPDFADLTTGHKDEAVRCAFRRRLGLCSASA